MPKLLVPLLKTVALSEPQWIDREIRFAAETPERDAIEVRQCFPFDDGRGWQYPGVRVLATLPGGPTDNGIRAQWPRMAVLADGYMVGFQQGAFNASRVFNGSGASVTQHGPARGIWPIAVKSAGEYVEAPPTTSQGVFGYLDGRWWTFDEIWQSPYAAFYRQGVLFHGWRSNLGILYLLFKSDRNGVPETVLVSETNSGRRGTYRVFLGHAEYPRGCSLPDGRVYVHAVDEHGQYLAALGPFPTLDNGEPSMPQPTVTILPGWPTTITLGESIPVAVTATNATAIDAFIEQGLTRIEATVSLPGRLVSLTPNAEGQWNLRARATNADSVDESQTPRIVTVLPAPPVEPPRPPLQVVTDGDIADLEEIVNQLRGIADRKARYVNARNEGLDHESALARYRTETAMAILGDAVSR